MVRRCKCDNISTLILTHPKWIPIVRATSCSLGRPPNQASFFEIDIGNAACNLQVRANFNFGKLAWYTEHYPQPTPPLSLCLQLALNDRMTQSKTKQRNCFRASPRPSAPLQVALKLRNYDVITSICLNEFLEILTFNFKDDVQTNPISLVRFQAKICMYSQQRDHCLTTYWSKISLHPTWLTSSVLVYCIAKSLPLSRILAGGRQMFWLLLAAKDALSWSRLWWTCLEP